MAKIVKVVRHSWNDNLKDWSLTVEYQSGEVRIYRDEFSCCPMTVYRFMTHRVPKIDGKNFIFE